MANTAKVNSGDKGEDVEADSIERAIDRLSLEQALRDFEVANARVIDLTQRLVASNHQVIEQQRELDERRVAYQTLHADFLAMRASAAYKLAAKFWALRDSLRG